MKQSEINSLIHSLNEISKKMASFQDDEQLLYKFVNNLSVSKLEFLYQEYENKNFKDIRHYKRYQGVKDCRKYLLERLLHGKKVNENIMEIARILVMKNAKKLGHKREIFHSWKNWSILYTFFYNLHKEMVYLRVERFVQKIIIDLNLEGYVKYHIVDFNGAQNFGNRRIWFAIYNKTHLSQRTANQIFFYIKENEVRYGLYKYTEVENNIEIIDIHNYSYDKMISNFKQLKNIVKNDIAVGTVKSTRGNKGVKEKNLMSYFKKGTKSGVVERVHNIIQQAFYESLCEQYKNDKDVKVDMEKNFIDISVEKSDSIELYEIKTSGNPIYCIREAIGQLLFYMSSLKNINKKIILTVMGKNELTEDAMEFKDFLINHLNVEFQYESFKI